MEITVKHRPISSASPLPVLTAPLDGTTIMLYCDNVDNAYFTGTESERLIKFWTVGLYSRGWHVASFSLDNDCFVSGPHRITGWLPMPLTMREFN